MSRQKNNNTAWMKSSWMNNLGRGEAVVWTEIKTSDIIIRKLVIDICEKNWKKSKVSYNKNLC